MPSTSCLRFTAATIATLSTLLAAPPVEAQSTDLFARVDQMPPPAGPVADRTLRSRVVTIDFDRLQSARTAAASLQAGRTGGVSARSAGRSPAPAPSATLTLNLFDDTVITGLVEWTEPTFRGGYSVSGRLVGDPLGTVTVVVNGERVAGSVRAANGTYRIRSVGEGLYAIDEVEESPLRCGIEGPHPETPDHRH